MHECVLVEVDMQAGTFAYSSGLETWLTVELWHLSGECCHNW